MEYQEFLMYCLIQDTENCHPLKGVEYDVAYEEIPQHFDIFSRSRYNNPDKGLYECIESFLNDNYVSKVAGWDEFFNDKIDVSKEHNAKDCKVWVSSTTIKNPSKEDIIGDFNKDGDLI